MQPSFFVDSCFLSVESLSSFIGTAVLAMFFSPTCTLQVVEVLFAFSIHCYVLSL